MKDRLFIFILFIAAALGIPRLFPVEKEKPPENFSVYITETKEILTLTAEEYLLGCLSAQIPLDYEQEALNAQASAAMTYALRLISDGVSAPEGADLSDDSKLFQPYFTNEKCLEIYGDSYSQYLPALKKAAEYGASHIITYKNEPIYALYHSVSAGKTRSAYGVWGRDFPYLQPVESKWDESYINFECRNEMTAEQARICLVKYKEGIETPADYGKWFSEFNANEDGYVISARIGENLLSGGDMWRIFGLRSTAFRVEYLNGIFTFITKGYGHGAGLSQYGANEMAKEGRTAKEILKYYYGEEVDVFSE